MSVIRVGSTGQYSSGWEHIFGGAKGRKAGGRKTAKAARPAAVKKTAKKAAKKAAGKTAKKSAKKAARR